MALGSALPKGLTDWDAEAGTPQTYTPYSTPYSGAEQWYCSRAVGSDGSCNVAGIFGSGSGSANGSSCQPANLAGFVGDGVTDNTAAWTAWTTAAGSASSCIQFGKGTYFFASSVSFTEAINQNLSFRGNGQNETFLEFGGSNGMTLNYTRTTAQNSSTAYFGNLSFLTTAAGTGTGLAVNGNCVIADVPQQTLLENVGFSGDNRTTHYWSQGAIFTDVENVRILNPAMWGKYNSFPPAGEGIKWVGTGAGTTPTQFIVDGGVTWYMDEGILASGYVQGLLVFGHNATGVNIGVECNMTVLQPQCDVIGNQLAAVHSAIKMTNVTNSFVSANLLYGGQYTGASAGDAMLNTAGLVYSSITDNQFVGSSAVALPNCMNLTASAIPQPATGNAVTGNSVNGCATVYNMGASNSNNIFKGNNVLQANITTYQANAASTDQFDDLEMGQPVPSACGTSPVMSGASTNRFGHFITGSSATTSCTLTFAGKHYQIEADCTALQLSGTTQINVSTMSTTQVTFTYPSSTSITIAYTCNGN